MNVVASQLRARRSLSLWFLGIGAALVLAALLAAPAIPRQAHRDFDALVQHYGSLSHTPSYPDVYRRMSADRRFIQNGYVGVSGLVLLAAGAFGLVRARDPGP
jgi:hypothetical protein